MPYAATIVRDLPSEMRPREELERRGARNVPDEVLLAILLRTGRQGQNVIDLARTVLNRCGGLLGLAGMTFAEIHAHKIPGLGRVKAMELAAALELGRRAAGQAPSAETSLLNDAEAVYNLLEPRVRHMPTEVFWVVLLNSKNRLMEQPFEVSKGTADSSLANPREVLMPAIRHNAVSMIIAHNHPSGDPTPSSADVRVTRQIAEAAKLMGIRLLDHVILGQPRGSQPGYISLRQQGLVVFD
ncbi:MAG: DNA repair protein RadC [Lentisphaerae bacterium]|jgi:DNA repair protein RadC|nr:DNA repair protein RadC [Lentisphaerota bacterium]